MAAVLGFVVFAFVVFFVVGVIGAAHVSGPVPITQVHRAAGAWALGRGRHHAYRFLSLMNDLHAVEQGRLPQRIVRKFIYKKAFHTAAAISRAIGVQK
jgi:hypothetical protein